MAELKIRIRQEGSSINCYFPLDLKSGESVQIASMHTGVATLHPQLFKAFQAFCTELARTLLEGTGATVERIEAYDAPEHEKAGHA